MKRSPSTAIDQTTRLAGTTHVLAASTTEADALAFWLGTKNRRGFVQAKGGIGWHVTDSRRQNTTGMPDVLMLLPKRDLSTLLVALEIKCGDDRVRPEQWDAMRRFYGIADCVSGIVRYVRPRVDEWTQDEAIANIERSLAA